MAEETADDGEPGIEERNGKGQEGGSHAEHSGGFLTPEQPIAAEEEADEEAAAIAQKDGGGIEVVAQKAEESGSEGGSGEGQRNIVLEQGRYQSGEGGEESDSSGEAIAPTDAAEIDTGSEDQDGSGDLAEEFLPRFEAEDVIEEAGGKDQSGGREKPPDEAEVTAHDVAALEGGGGGDGERGQVGNSNGDAADPGDGGGVDFAVVVRPIQHTPADREVPADRGKDERGSESRGGDYEQRVHGRYLRGESQPDGVHSIRQHERTAVPGLLHITSGQRHVKYQKAEVIDLFGTDAREGHRQGTCVIEVGVIKEEARTTVVRLLVEMIDTIRVERRGAAFQAVDFIPFV